MPKEVKEILNVEKISDPESATFLAQYLMKNEEVKLALKVFDKCLSLSKKNKDCKRGKETILIMKERQDRENIFNMDDFISTNNEVKNR